MNSRPANSLRQRVATQRLLEELEQLGYCVVPDVIPVSCIPAIRASVLQPLDARGLAAFALEHASAVSVVVSLETRSKKRWGLCRGPPESAEERAADEKREERYQRDERRKAPRDEAELEEHLIM